MKDKNGLYWIWLSERCGIASKEFGKLAARYDNPFDLYRMDEDEIEHLEGIGAALKARLCDKSLDRAYASYRYCQQNGVELIAYSDPRYPSRLRNIEDPPVLLYTLGKLPDLNHRLCVGMVGTRKMSEYGRQSAYTISYELAAANAVIVSGMASGVDGVCACGAMAAGGDTVAVLGCGISMAYPKEHAPLMKAIAKKGAVITEYPPNMPPFGANFPKRNRIISGLSQGVLVVEGVVGSGALITAKKAVEQGRELFALPGKIDENNSDGPNELIQKGALVALSSDDILRYYDFLYHDTLKYHGLKKAKISKPSVDEILCQYGVPDTSDRGSRTASRKKASTEVGARPARKQKERSPEPLSEPLTEPVKDPSAASSVLESLDEATRLVFEAMPLARAVTPDALVSPKVDVGNVITALTLLELNGLITSLPGGMYVRK